jgi:hypothetical protein
MRTDGMSNGSEQIVIGLLLEEYRSLREAIVARATARAQMLAYVGAGAAVIITIGGRTVIAAIVIPGLILFGLLVFASMNRIGTIQSLHVAELERRINALCRDAYGVSEDIFTWESAKKWDDGWLPAAWLPGFLR